MENTSACHCCGLIQLIPEAKPENAYWACKRCRTPLRHKRGGQNRLSLSLSITALVFYFPAILLPMLKLEKLGHVHESSLLSGVITMLADGYIFIGVIVFLFSIILPPFKLLSLIFLSRKKFIKAHHHKALVYRLVEWLGKWGMLDVMLVAILISFVKLGDLVSIYPGSGLILFAVMVLFSLIAGLFFNPRILWEETSIDHE